MTIRSIQYKLYELGYYRGKIDGSNGPLTNKAIKDFQKAKNLSQDGIVGRLTYTALFGVYIPFEYEMEKFYGKPGTNQTLVKFPYAMYYDGSPVKQFTINTLAAEDALKALTRIGEIYSEKERAEIGLDQFCGCYANRNKRGGTTLSTHAYACAIDFDQARNQLSWGKDKARLAHSDAEPFWVVWESFGWVSLGREENRDFMHVQRARRS